MKYIICEDRKGGFYFWETVNALLFNNYFDAVISAVNKDSIPAAVGKIENLSCGDVIFTAYDNISKPKIAIMLTKMERLQIRYGFEWIQPDYYSIQAIFLSFKFLLDWCKYTGILQSSYDIVRNCILESQNCYITHPETEETVRVLIGYKNRVTIETFYKKLYGMIISNDNRNFAGQFSIDRSKTVISADGQEVEVSTSCWFNDCCDYMFEKDCKTLCGIADKITTAKERLEILFHNSMLAESKVGLKLLHRAINNNGIS